MGCTRRRRKRFQPPRCQRVVWTIYERIPPSLAAAVLRRPRIACFLPYSPPPILEQARPARWLVAAGVQQPVMIVGVYCGRLLRGVRPFLFPGRKWRLWLGLLVPSPA